MSLYSYVRDLNRSGYSYAQILEHMEQMFNITLHWGAVFKICENATDQIIELQYSPNKLWCRAMEKVDMHTFESYYSEPDKEFQQTKMIEELGISYSEYVHLREIYYNKNTFDYFKKSVRTKILNADEHRCRVCNRKAIHTHHIVPGAGDVFENGVSVCVPCHKALHEKLNQRPLKKDYTRDTWEEFLKDFKITKDLSKT